MMTTIPSLAPSAQTYQTSLQQAVDQYRAALPANNRFEFSITDLDRLGEPVYVVSTWGSDSQFDNGIGYGLSELGAQVSALGEAAEGYYAPRALLGMKRWQGSFYQLQREGLTVLDPVSLCLDAGCGYNDAMELTWVEACRFPSGRKVLVPLEAAAISVYDLALNEAGQPSLFTPITNGLGAGTSFEQALSHGLLELIQRDGDSVTFRAMDQGVAVDLDAVTDPDTRALLQALKDEEVDVVVKLAATDFGIPVLYVVGADRDVERPPFALMLSACGEAAHPDRERALAKALREYVAARARKRFMHGSFEDLARVAPHDFVERVKRVKPYGDDQRSLKGILDWINMPRASFYNEICKPVLNIKSRVPFSQLPTCVSSEAADAQSLLNLLYQRLAVEGLEILYVPLADGSDGVHAVKAIVPGLEVETMSYGRIGRRNLDRLLAQDVDFVGLETMPAGAVPVHLSKEDEALFGGPAWLHPQRLDRRVGSLYGLYREPHSHTVPHFLDR